MKQTALAETALDTCLDSKQAPSRHCWLALKDCKTGNYVEININVLGI